MQFVKKIGEEAKKVSDKVEAKMEKIVQ